MPAPVAGRCSCAWCFAAGPANIASIPLGVEPLRQNSARSGMSFLCPVPLVRCEGPGPLPPWESLLVCILTMLVNPGEPQVRS